MMETPSPIIEDIIKKNPGMSVADAQLRLLYRRLPKYVFKLLLLFCAACIWAIAKPKGARAPKAPWVGEWVVRGVSCDAEHFIFHKDHYAEPGQRITRTGQKSLFDGTVQFTKSDGTNIFLVPRDINTLIWRSSKSDIGLTLRRC